jgi:aryl-alcohol dehydrogenase-like predicted oxidoreductase
MTPQYRPLGNSGLRIAPLVLGGNVFGWTADEATSFKLLDAFVAAGFNCIDTADVYSKWAPGHHGGESETVIGRWLKQNSKRGQVIIATKVGYEMSETDRGLSRGYIFRAIEGSLQRLQTDHVDLYQSHKDDPATPQEETLEAYAQLIKQGKVRAIGASNFTGERLASALEISRRNNLPRYESLQPHYNLVERAEYERDLEPVCLRERLGVIPFFSLAAGFLTGKYRSAADAEGKPRAPRVMKYLNERGFRVLAALDEVAGQLHSTPTRVALAWLLARPSITAPIASATNLEQLKDLLAATELTLDPASIELLNRASDYESSERAAS